MPYIVTTKRRTTEQDSQGYSFYVPVVSRRAVATLEEARRATQQIVADADERDDGAPYRVGLAARTLPEQGGTITLPDGTVIEVERVSDVDLWERMGAPKDVRPTHDLVAAYNTRQS